MQEAPLERNKKARMVAGLRARSGGGSRGRGCVSASGSPPADRRPTRRDAPPVPAPDSGRGARGRATASLVWRCAEAGGATSDLASLGRLVGGRSRFGRRGSVLFSRWGRSL